ncbi:MAG TPA: hypothetical protein VF077_07635 [Nitrospiraceae bacterium]
MPATLSLQHFRLVSGFVNTTNDPSPGSNIASSSFAGGIVQSYAGLVGGRLVLDGKEAAKLSDTSVGTLYGGIYQYVRLAPGSVASAVRGQAAYWSDREAYVVTADQSATNAAKFAGVFLNTITKGNYGFVQVVGKATLLCKSTLTKAGADGDLIVLDAATSPTFDTIADATAIVSPNLKLMVGAWLEAPANAALKLGEIWNLRNVL